MPQKEHNDMESAMVKCGITNVCDASEIFDEWQLACVPNPGDLIANINGPATYFEVLRVVYTNGLRSPGILVRPVGPQSDYQRALGTTSLP